MNVSCLACGADLPLQFKYTKVIVCPFCRMTLFLEDDVVRQAGKSSVLASAKLLFKLGQRYHTPTLTFVPIGYVRLDYGNGFWDEWFVLGSDGKCYWVTFDEGDISIQYPVDIKNLPVFNDLLIGTPVNLDGHLLGVTEKNVCKVKCWEGEIPDWFTPQDSISYVDLSGGENLIYSLEYWPKAVKCFKGEWINSKDLKVG